MSTASDIATLKTQVAKLQAQVTALQQRAARDEVQIRLTQAKLDRVKKG